MARAYGSSAHLLMKRQTVYGQAATGDYIRMHFNRCNLGSEQGLIDDPVLGQGRDPLAPLQDDLTVTVKPLTTAGMAAARAAARRSVEAIERQARERQEAGLQPDGLPNLSADGDGFYQAQLIRELAVRHITSWTGVDLAVARHRQLRRTSLR